MGQVSDLKRMRDRTYELQSAVITESRREKPVDDAERLVAIVAELQSGPQRSAHRPLEPQCDEIIAI
jgi:hypothetical protein